MRGDIPVTGDINLVFGTPVLMTDIPDVQGVNAALLARIRTAQAADPGVQTSNIGGWQSRHDLWGWDDPAIAALREAMQHALLTVAALRIDETDLVRVDVRYQVRAFANVNRPGDYNARHSHARYDWTLVYFVACGTPAADRPLAGRLEIHDPRHLAELSPLHEFGFAGAIVIDPVPGKLVLFPAWLEHSIHPWQGSGEQVSIVAAARVVGGRDSGLAG